MIHFRVEPGLRLRRLAVLVLSLLAAVHVARAQTVILEETFEGAFPGTGWAVGDLEPSEFDATWDAVDLASFGSPPLRPTGSYAGYCAGLGYDGFEFSPVYQDDMLAAMSHEINLAGYTTVTLSFWHTIPSIELGVDQCAVIVDSDVVFARSFSTSWRQETIDLSSYAGGTHSLAFVFFSDDSITAEGWYVDDIVVTGQGGLNTPQIVNPQYANSVFSLSVQTQPGATYYLEAKVTLEEANWTILDSRPGSGEMVTFNDNNATNPTKFYRVRAQ